MSDFQYVRYRPIPRGARFVNKVMRKMRRQSNKRKYNLARRRKIPLSKIPKSILPEVKKFDYEGSLLNIQTAGTGPLQTSAFTNISQGDTVSTRTGQAIFVKYVVINMLITSSEVATWNSTRIAFHLDKQPYGSSYAAGVPWTTLYEDASTNILDTLSMPNTTSTGRFKLVKSIFFVRSPHLIEVSGGAPGATPVDSIAANPPVHFHIKIPINKTVRFQDGSNEVSSGVKLYLTAWSNQDAGSCPIMNFYARTYFTDA